MNDIHPTCIIDGAVVLGRNNKILPYTILIGPLEIGDNNIIGPYVIIGSPGADTKNPRYDDSKARIQIGSNNIIREFSAIQKPAHGDLTKIGSGVYLMQAANISHDVFIEDNVVITAHCAVAGLVKILDGANLGMGATISQRVVIGQYSIIGTGMAVLKNVPPFTRYIRGQPTTVNEYALKKFGLLDHADEIRNYVLKSIAPTSGKISKIVSHFESESFKRLIKPD